MLRIRSMRSIPPWSSLKVIHGSDSPTRPIAVAAQLERHLVVVARHHHVDLSGLVHEDGRGGLRTFCQVETHAGEIAQRIVQVRHRNRNKSGVGANAQGGPAGAAQHVADPFLGAIFFRHDLRFCLFATTSMIGGHGGIRTRINTATMVFDAIGPAAIGNARQWQTRHRSQHLLPQPYSPTGFPAASGATRTAGNTTFLAVALPSLPARPIKKEVTRTGGL
ncbi:hypothetical protein ABID97_004798 [Variovorax sp. OAS795]